jgi:hypothetical protein
MNHQTGTLYQFTEKNSENLVARTTDVRELKKFMLSDWIAIGEPVEINSVRYDIVHIVIEPFLGTPQLYEPENKNYYDFGEGASWTVHARIYLSPKNLK